LLLPARDQEGKPMTDQELRDELMSLMFAGSETTATALGHYTVHCLPGVREKLLKNWKLLVTSQIP